MLEYITTILDYLNNSLNERIVTSAGSSSATLAEFWAKYEEITQSTDMVAFLIFRDTGGWTPATGWWRAFVSAQNRTGREYDAYGSILLTKGSKTLWLGTVSGKASDYSDFTVSWLNLTNFLPLTGGTLSGNITVKNTEPSVDVDDTDNSHGIALVSSSGNVGLYDRLFSKWILRVAPDGTTSFDGVSSKANLADKLSTGRNITVGNATKSFDGSSAITFGLDEIGAAKTGTIIDNGVDLNTITTSGFYRLNTNHSNSPKNLGYSCDWSQMIVCHGGGDTIFQMIVHYGDNTLFIRSGNPSNTGGSGNWNAWKKMIDSSCFSLSGTTLTINI